MDDYDYTDAHTGEGLTHDEMGEWFAEYLDSDGDVDVMGLTLQPSRIWQEVDPVAFRCGVSDYVDMLLTDGDIREGAPEDDEDDEEDDEDE